MRPLTSPSGIFASNPAGAPAVCAAATAGSIAIAISRIALANMRISALYDIDVRKRRLQPFGELLGVVIGPEMHEVEVRLVVEHVVVDRRDLDPVLAQR